MFTIRKTDKRSNITYVYECENRWSKEEKKVKCYRTLVGKVDAEGNVRPTDGRGKRRGIKQETVTPPVPVNGGRVSYKTLWEELSRENEALKKEQRIRDDRIDELQKASNRCTEQQPGLNDANLTDSFSELSL